LPLLGWIILFTAVGGIASAAFAGLFLLLPEKTGLRMLPHFVSFATGALIGAALLGLLPEAMQSVGPGGAHGIGVALVVGLGVFFIIEKLVLWRHAHSHEHEDPIEREVQARGVTDTLAHDDVPNDHGLPDVIPEPARSVAFAGNVGGQPTVRSDALAPGLPLRSRSQGGRPDAPSGHGDGTHSHDQAARGHEQGHSLESGHKLESGQGNEQEPAQGYGTAQQPGRDQEQHRAQQHSHDHGGHGHDHSRDGAAGVLVLIGDSIHNALDGILIAAAFLTNVPLGLVTTLAVAAHEIPHRVGDFALLLHAGMSRQRAMFLNMATGLASVLGGIVAYFGLSKARDALPYALALAAAGFLYIAVAGLIPGLHRRADPRTSLAQVLLMGLGVGVIAWAESLTG
jgi:zinc and cadmium transporter